MNTAYLAFRSRDFGVYFWWRIDGALAEWTCLVGQQPLVTESMGKRNYVVDYDETYLINACRVEVMLARQKPHLVTVLVIAQAYRTPRTH
jgi:hypothetical protein